MMTGEDDGVIVGDDVDADIVSLLDDKYARAVLVNTYDQTRTAEDLVNRFDIASSTVYERLSQLVECDLFVEQQRIDPDGHHHKVYRACLDRVVVDLTGELQSEWDKRDKQPWKSPKWQTSKLMSPTPGLRY